jgi:predicted Fe-S protein YdhL (DUF1289 family)
MSEMSVPLVQSPCVDVCVMDEATGFCTGCRRTLEEIGGWLSYSNPERIAVLDALPSRRVTAADPAATVDVD